MIRYILSQMKEFSIKRFHFSPFYPYLGIYSILVADKIYQRTSQTHPKNCMEEKKHRNNQDHF